MKKTVLLLWVGNLLGLSCLAQDGYTISGRVRGIATDKVYVVAADFGKADTLASAAVTNGNFLLQGTVPGDARAVNLVFAGVEDNIPLLLENTTYQLQVSTGNALLNGGGKAAELYKAFNKIGQDYATAQSAIMEEYESSDGNPAKEDALQFQLDEAYQASVQKTLDLIKANADNYVSAYVVALAAQTDDEALLRQKYDLLGEAAKATVPGKAAAAALERYGSLVVGKPAPDFSVKRPNGDDLTLSAVPAKLKLLVFWRSDNALCRQANPQLIQLYTQFRSKSFTIVSVSLDENRLAWTRALEFDGISIWDNGSDLQGLASPAARAYMIGSTLPYYVLVNSEGNIAAITGDLSAIRDKLTELTKREKRKK